MFYYPRVRPTGTVRRIKEFSSTRTGMIYTLTKGYKITYNDGLTGTDEEGNVWYMISNKKGETVGFAREEDVDKNSPMYPPSSGW